MVRAQGSESLDHMPCVAVEIPGPGEPVLARRTVWCKLNRCRESRYVDDQRVPLPSAVRPSHPRIDRRLRRFSHIDFATSIRVLVDDRQPLFALTDTGK